MRIALIVVTAFIAIEAVVLVAFPGAVKRAVEELSPGPLRVAGLVEAAAAAVLVWLIVTGVP